MVTFVNKVVTFVNNMVTFVNNMVTFVNEVVTFENCPKWKWRLFKPPTIGTKDLPRDILDVRLNRITTIS